MKKPVYLILGVLAIGFGLRLCGITYGLGFVVAPDETRQVLDALGMGARLSLLPADFAYGAIHKYLLLFIYSIYFIIGKLAGTFSDKFSFALNFIKQPYSFYLLARIFSALAGTAVIFTVYKAAKEIYNLRIAVIAAVLAALNFHLVQLSYWANSDILLVFFSSLSLWFIFRLMARANLRSLAWASIAVGLAISTKFQGVMLIMPLGFALFSAFYRQKKLWKAILFCGFLVVLASLIGNLQYVFAPGQAIGKFLEIFQASKFGISSAPLFKHNFLQSALWYLKELIRQDGLIGLIFCLGIIYAIAKFKARKNQPLLLFLLTFFILFSRSSLRYIYYGALIFPALCLLGAKFLDDLYLRFKPKKIWAGLFVSFAILISLRPVLEASFQRLAPDTRQLAKEWARNNIKAGSKIAIDWYELSVPLASEIPPMMRAGKAEKFYNIFVPQGVQDQYKEFVFAEGGYYDIVPVIYEKEEGFWPEGMPHKARERAKELELARRLYRTFNFLNLDQLCRKKTEYLIISSYSYSHFLFDDDPDKTELFNPYIKEDTLANNRQAKIYDPNQQESILFFFNQRARDFYLPVLSSRDKRVTLLKEFKPDKSNLGPVIKIYKLNCWRN